jgi:hypothetical protein
MVASDGCFFLVCYSRLSFMIKPKRRHPRLWPFDYLFIRGLFNESLCVLWGASFFIGGLLNEPLCVLWGASFFIGGLFNESLCILWGAPFFIRGLLNEPLCILQVPLFSSEVF